METSLIINDVFEKGKEFAKGGGWIWKNGTITTDFDETIKILRQNHYPNNNLDDDRLLELAVSDDIVYWTYFDEYREDIPYWVLNTLKLI